MRMMSCKTVHYLLGLGTLSFPTLAHGQTIPVRTVSTTASTDSGLFSGITTVRALSDGRVLVNDLTRRRLVFLDSSLKRFNFLADTAAGAPNRFGAQRIRLLPFLGDSSLWIDEDASAIVLIEPSGKFGRVMAHPKQSDINNVLTFTPHCACGVDPKGRLVYTTRRRPPPGPPLAENPPMDGAAVPVITRIYNDSAVVLRADFDTRSVDTIATLQATPIKQGMISVQPRGLTGFSVFHPLPVTDEWALMPDGTIAIVRTQDYHVDWVDMSGQKTSSPRMPFAWKRITTEEKEQLLDSARRVAAARPAPEPPFRLAPFVTVKADEIADYYPPVRTGQVRADADGNLWILPSTAVGSDKGLVYDVVNRSGVIFQRVKLPEGRNLVGFGKGGVLFMVYAPSPQRIFLERAAVIR
jgi:hypothetical protein